MGKGCGILVTAVSMAIAGAPASASDGRARHNDPGILQLTDAPSGAVGDHGPIGDDGAGGGQPSDGGGAIGDGGSPSGDGANGGEGGGAKGTPSPAAGSGLCALLALALGYRLLRRRVRA